MRQKIKNLTTSKVYIVQYMYYDTSYEDKAFLIRDEAEERANKLNKENKENKGDAYWDVIELELVKSLWNRKNA